MNLSSIVADIDVSKAKLEGCLSANILDDLEKVLNQEYIRTNENIVSGANKYIKVKKINDYILKTPALGSVKFSNVAI